MTAFRSTPGGAPPFVVAAAGAALLMAPVVTSPYALIVLSYAFVFSIACLGFNLRFGMTGLLSLGHAAFFGLGAYAGGFAYAFADWKSLELYLAAGVVAGTAVAAGAGAVCVRTTRMHFTILTLAFGQIVHALFVGGVVFRSFGAVGEGLFLLGGGGLYIPRFAIAGIEFESSAFTIAVYYPALGALALSAGALWRLRCSPFGLPLQAIRDNDVRAAFIGLPVRRHRWLAFVISGAVTALAGALFGPLSRQVTPEQLHWLWSATLVVATVLGGTRYFWGRWSAPLCSSHSRRSRSASRFNAVWSSAGCSSRWSWRSPAASLVAWLPWCRRSGALPTACALEMRRRRGTLAAALAVVVGARWRPRWLALAVLMLAALSEVQSAAACRDCLQAGAASAALRVPPGTSLAGYGSAARRLMFPDLFARYEHAFWFKPHTGDLDKLMTRVLVLERGTARLLWVALDVVAVDRAFTGALAQRLGLAAASNTTLIVSASHTHSGPGAFIDSAVMGFLAVDRLDRTVRDALLESVVGVVRRASAGSRPARIGVASVTPPAVTTGRLGRAVDPEMIVVKFTTLGGSPIALLWNYAIHGTALGPRNLHLSSDVMGMASTLAEEALSVPVLFVNGAVADVSPRRHGRDGALASARELAESLRKAWHEAEAHRRAVIEVRTKTVRLGAPHLSLRNCVGGWVPRRLPLPLGSTFPQDAELIGVNLGPVVSVSVPGELQSVLGGVVKRAASEHWRHAFIAGLSNDYLGYFVTAADYDRPSYVACANLYGRRAGDEIARVAAQLVGDLAADHPRLSKRP